MKHIFSSLNPQQSGSDSQPSQSLNWMVVLLVVTVITVTIQAIVMMTSENNDGIMVREIRNQSSEVHLSRSFRSNRYVRPIVERASEVEAMLETVDSRNRLMQQHQAVVAQLEGFNPLLLTLPAAQLHASLTQDGDVQLIPSLSYINPNSLKVASKISVTLSGNEEQHPIMSATEFLASQKEQGKGSGAQQD